MPKMRNIIQSANAVCVRLSPPRNADLVMTDFRAVETGLREVRESIGFFGTEKHLMSGERGSRRLGDYFLLALKNGHLERIR